MKKLPHFLVLGTQKGGTTSLHKLLNNHPGVYLPPCKEVHYFSLHWDKPESWYTSHFNEAKWFKRRGEITPYYLYHPEAPNRIYQTIPKARLIVLLRDPLERTLSQIFHARRHGFENQEPATAIAMENERLNSGSTYSHQKHSYVARSKYLEQLDRYEQIFPKKQMLIIKSEDFFENPQKPWQRIQKHLRLSEIGIREGLHIANAGKGEAKDINQELREVLKEKLRETTEGIKSRYGIDWGWE